MHITKKDVSVILGATVVLLFLALGGTWWLGDVALVATVVIANMLVLAGVFETYRRAAYRQVKAAHAQEESGKDHYRQMEALFSIFFSLKPAYPLPDTRGWAASPDFMKKVLEIIYRDRPRLIVEASSGVSTLLIAYCLKQVGCGSVISLEHDADYARATRELIAFHGVEDVAQVIHAPLVETAINGGSWLWYDTSSLTLESPIDLLVIDGPPESTQKMARYPALPVLFAHLREGSKVLLDDGSRQDEQEMVGRWTEELGGLASEFLDFEKGAFLMTRLVSARPEQIPGGAAGDRSW